MNSLLIKMEENLKEQWVALAPQTKPKAIRNGYYLINNASYQKIALGEVIIATANWNPNGSDLFLETTQFEIILSPLYYDSSIGPKAISAFDLIGKVLSISHVERKNELVFGEIRNVYVGTWEIISAQPTFLNSENILFHTLSNGKNDILVIDAWNNFAATAPYDANGAVAAEGDGDPLDYDGDSDHDPAN